MTTKVILTAAAMNSLKEIAKTENYTMWYGNVEQNNDAIRITKIIVPEQKNNQVSSTISTGASAKIMMENLEENFNCFGVSRTTGGTSTSATEEQMFATISAAHSISDAADQAAVTCIDDKNGNLRFSVWEDGVRTGDNIPWEAE